MTEPFSRLDAIRYAWVEPDEDDFEPELRAAHHDFVYLMDRHDRAERDRDDAQAMVGAFVAVTTKEQQDRARELFDLAKTRGEERFE